MGYRIVVGPWYFDPVRMIATNVHNGTKAYFTETYEGWNIICYNCPAEWMMDRLINWFKLWITGEVKDVANSREDARVSTGS